MADDYPDYEDDNGNQALASRVSSRYEDPDAEDNWDPDHKLANVPHWKSGNYPTYMVKTGLAEGEEPSSGLGPVPPQGGIGVVHCMITPADRPPSYGDGLMSFSDPDTLPPAFEAGADIQPNAFPLDNGMTLHLSGGGDPYWHNYDIPNFPQRNAYGAIHFELRDSLGVLQTGINLRTQDTLHLGQNVVVQNGTDNMVLNLATDGKVQQWGYWNQGGVENPPTNWWIGSDGGGKPTEFSCAVSIQAVTDATEEAAVSASSQQVDRNKARRAARKAQLNQTITGSDEK